MSKSKKLSEWEKVKNSMVVNATDKQLDKTMTEEEFDAIPFIDRLGVMYKDRVKFLKDNGYEVTRANMMDANLSVRQPEE